MSIPNMNHHAQLKHLFSSKRPRPTWTHAKLYQPKNNVDPNALDIPRTTRAPSLEEPWKEMNIQALTISLALNTDADLEYTPARTYHSPASVTKRLKMKAAVRRLRREVNHWVLTYFKCNANWDNLPKDNDLTSLLRMIKISFDRVPHWYMLKDLRAARNALKYRDAVQDIANYYVKKIRLENPAAETLNLSFMQCCEDFDVAKFKDWYVTTAPDGESKLDSIFKWIRRNARDVLFRPVEEKIVGKRNNRGFHFLATSIYCMNLSESDWQSSLRDLVALAPGEMKRNWDDQRNALIKELEDAERLKKAMAKNREDMAAFFRRNSKKQASRRVDTVPGNTRPLDDSVLRNMRPLGDSSRPQRLPRGSKAPSAIISSTVCTPPNVPSNIQTSMSRQQPDRVPFESDFEDDPDEGEESCDGEQLLSDNEHESSSEEEDSNSASDSGSGSENGSPNRGNGEGSGQSRRKKRVPTRPAPRAGPSVSRKNQTDGRPQPSKKNTTTPGDGEDSSGSEDEELICSYTPCKRAVGKPFKKPMTFETHIRKWHTNNETGKIKHKRRDANIGSTETVNEGQNVSSSTRARNISSSNGESSRSVTSNTIAPSKRGPIPQTTIKRDIDGSLSNLSDWSDFNPNEDVDFSISDASTQRKPRSQPRRKRKVLPSSRKGKEVVRRADSDSEATSEDNNPPSTRKGKKVVRIADSDSEDTSEDNNPPNNWKGKEVVRKKLKKSSGTSAAVKEKGVQRDNNARPIDANPSSAQSSSKKRKRVANSGSSGEIGDSITVNVSGRRDVIHRRRTEQGEMSTGGPSRNRTEVGESSNSSRIPGESSISRRRTIPAVARPAPTSAASTIPAVARQGPTLGTFMIPAVARPVVARPAVARPAVARPDVACPAVAHPAPTPGASTIPAVARQALINAPRTTTIPIIARSLLYSRISTKPPVARQFPNSEFRLPAVQRMPESDGKVLVMVTYDIIEQWFPSETMKISLEANPEDGINLEELADTETYWVANGPDFEGNMPINVVTSYQVVEKWEIDAPLRSILNSGGRIMIDTFPQDGHTLHQKLAETGAIPFPRDADDKTLPQRVVDVGRAAASIIPGKASQVLKSVLVKHKDQRVSIQDVKKLDDGTYGQVDAVVTLYTPQYEGEEDIDMFGDMDDESIQWSDEEYEEYEEEEDVDMFSVMADIVEALESSGVYHFIGRSKDLDGQCTQLISELESWIARLEFDRPI